MIALSNKSWYSRFMEGIMKKLSLLLIVLLILTGCQKALDPSRFTYVGEDGTVTYSFEDDVTVLKKGEFNHRERVLYVYFEPRADDTGFLSNLLNHEVREMLELGLLDLKIMPLLFSEPAQDDDYAVYVKYYLSVSENYPEVSYEFLEKFLEFDIIPERKDLDEVVLELGLSKDDLKVIDKDLRRTFNQNIKAGTELFYKDFDESLVLVLEVDKKFFYIPTDVPDLSKTLIHTIYETANDVETKQLEHTFPKYFE